MKITSKLRRGAIAHAVLFTIGAGATAVFAADTRVDVGKFEYEGACAVCHGATDKGNGPFTGATDDQNPRSHRASRTTAVRFPSTSCIR